MINFEFVYFQRRRCACLLFFEWYLVYRSLSPSANARRWKMETFPWERAVAESPSKWKLRCMTKGDTSMIRIELYSVVMGQSSQLANLETANIRSSVKCKYFLRAGQTHWYTLSVWWFMLAPRHATKPSGSWKAAAWLYFARSMHLNVRPHLHTFAAKCGHRTHTHTCRPALTQLDFDPFAHKTAKFWSTNPAGKFNLHFISR